MTQIGRLEKYPLRSVWEREASSFTPWLSENIEYISELLGFALNVDEVEKQVGRFSADIVAEDPNYGIVIIENQFEKSNHDHLGKILTYIANLNAKIGIWICEDPSQEHINVIDWLNEVSPKDVQFFLIKVEAVKIGESNPAPLFTILSKPEESKEIGRLKGKMADRHIKRMEFWSQFLEKCNERLPLYANRKTTKDNWILLVQVYPD